jgi:hypothetical protein
MQAAAPCSQNQKRLRLGEAFFVSSFEYQASYKHRPVRRMPGIQALAIEKAWMAGTGPAMTDAE